MKFVRQLLLWVLLASTCSNAIAQYGYVAPAANTWKKQVGRMVDVPVQKSKSARARKRQRTLYQLIIEAWKAGDISLYSNADQSFSRKLDTEAVTLIINSNPVTYRPQSRYRILEEWTFNPITSKTDIQIAGIAPMREIYGPDGEYRGRQATFWVKYSDFAKLLARDEQLHGANALVSRIWADYFEQNSKVITTSKVWQTTATRSIVLPVNTDTSTHHLLEYDNLTLFDILQQKQRAGQESIPSYANDDFVTPLDKWAVANSDIEKVDTTVVVDPVSHTEVFKYMTRNLYDPTHPEYDIAERWSFNPLNGKTEIEIKGIAPVARSTTNYPHGSKTTVIPLFWMKYKDVWPVISKYDQYHPGNSVGLSIWDSYFLSDKKPVAIISSPAH